MAAQRRGDTGPRNPDSYFLAAADFHAQAASVFEATGQRALAGLARRHEAEARSRAHAPYPRPRRSAGGA
jgi:hypothetical protein